MVVNRRNYLIIWGVLVLATIAWGMIYWHFLPHLPDTYSGEAVYGRVIDAETGQPIAGAIVVGINPLSEPYSVNGSIVAGYMHVEEVMTDMDGNYHLAAWGPKPRYGNSYLVNDGPVILIYKNGYSLYTNHTSFPDNRFSPVQKSMNADQVIKLKRFHGNLQQYMEDLSNISIELNTLLDPRLGARNCAWMSTPRIMVELDRLLHLARGQEIPASGIPDIEGLVAGEQCGTREDFLGRYTNEIMDDNQRSGGSNN